MANLGNQSNTVITHIPQGIVSKKILDIWLSPQANYYCLFYLYPNPNYKNLVHLHSNDVYAAQTLKTLIQGKKTSMVVSATDPSLFLWLNSATQGTEMHLIYQLIVMPPQDCCWQLHDFPASLSACLSECEA